LGPVAVVSQGIALDTGGKTFAGAVVADGATYLWGDNGNEQLGNESLSNTGTATPTAVPSFDAIP
jgi:alpha-tubulin suppressor-like RCC1 family protein